MSEICPNCGFSSDLSPRGKRTFERRIEALTEALQALLDACNVRHVVDFETSMAMEWADDILKGNKG